MPNKYKLLNTPEEFEAKEAEMKTLLSIPDGKGTVGYADSRVIDNPDHADYGKFIFPVVTSGKWKCDDQFEDSELVDYDPDWVNEEAPEIDG